MGIVRPPRKGDVYVISTKLFVNNVAAYKVGGTITLLYKIDQKTDKWRCIDEFGIGEWAWFSSRITQHHVELLIAGAGDR